MRLALIAAILTLAAAAYMNHLRIELVEKLAHANAATTADLIEAIIPESAR
jgi:hypothetical protein